MQLKRRISAIRELSTRLGRSVKLMEVCGTHTMAAFRSGLRSLLPGNVALLSGPGCPVCVTPNGYLDRALAIAELPDTVVATFGDMVRVPGSRSSLERARAEGAHVRVVYSPLDALEYAKKNGNRRVVFLGVGFETTAPGIAWTIKEAFEQGVKNYLVLSAHKMIPPAMAALLDGELRIDGFMCPGHVSVVIGASAYRFVAEDHHVPCVVTGFEPLDMVAGVEMLLRQIAAGRAEVEIQYSRSVGWGGNREALAVVEEVLEPCDAEWRGLGTIARSGLRIRPKYSDHDAARLLDGVSIPSPIENPGCICGEILGGMKVPYDCALFARSCTPSSPVGACMVSSEGTCAAYYKYARLGGSPAEPRRNGSAPGAGRSAGTQKT
jgi:hydrogenase expression/formation protein HypD